MKRIPIVIHGLAGALPFVSRGTRNIDKLIDALPQTIDSRDFRQTNQKAVLDYILDCRDRYGKIEVIGVGHSMGCYRWIWIARQCAKRGIKIRYLAAIDPTAINRLLGMKPMLVPDNVQWVDEFWATSGFPESARTRDPSGKGGGKYLYPRSNMNRTVTIPATHIGLASNKAVISRIVSQIKELL